MPRKGITKESIVDSAVELIEQKGLRAFSLNELARNLKIKPASLYNHIEGMEELVGLVGHRIAEMIKQTQLTAIEGKTGDEALYALCCAYRSFAMEHQDLYTVIMAMQKDRNANTEKACGEIIEPMLTVLSGYSLSETDKMHWQRILRATIHGFITHEYAGGFKLFPIDCNDTYRMAVNSIALGIHASQGGQNT